MQMPAFLSCSRDTFLFAFQLLQVLILWQPELSWALWVCGLNTTKLPFLLLTSQLMCTLPVSEHPGKPGRTCCQRDSFRTQWPFPHWKRHSIKLDQRGCSGSVGGVQDTRLKWCLTLKFVDFWVSSGSGHLGHPLSAPKDWSYSPSLCASDKCFCHSRLFLNTFLVTVLGRTSSDRNSGHSSSLWHFTPLVGVLRKQGAEV